MKTLKQIFFVKSAEISSCPCCGDSLIVYGSRKRGYIDINGTKNTLVIRRLKCTACSKIHHELPDILVPYKRYSSECIEEAIMNKQTCFVSADESTLYRWRRWFSDVKEYFLNCIIAMLKQLDYKANEQLSRPHGTALEGIMDLVGQREKWLAQVVRKLVNTKMWVQTRSALMS